MKLSMLINRLFEIKTKFGNLDVRICFDDGKGNVIGNWCYDIIIEQSVDDTNIVIYVPTWFNNRYDLEPMMCGWKDKFSLEPINVCGGGVID